MLNDQPLATGNFPKDIDVDLLVFVERYATNHIRWDTLVYFGCHPDASLPIETIAREIGRSYQAVRPEIGDLTMLGVFERLNHHHPPLYQLTRNTNVRRLVLKLAQKSSPPQRT